MSLTLTKLAETGSTITLGWTPPSGVDGYVIYANGQVVSIATANLKNGQPRNKVEFSKTNPGPPFRVAAVVSNPDPAVEWDEYPDSTEPEPEPGGWYPASWQLTGPLGKDVPLPSREGAFLILWPGQPGGPTTWTQFQQRIALREQQWGRKPDAIMSTGPEGSTLEQSLAWIRDHGCLPIVAGVNFGNHDGVLNGSKNAAIDGFAQKMKALGVIVMVRLNHEFNYSHLSYTSIGQEAKFIDSWEYIVHRIHVVNGATNVGFWFCPAEGGDGQARASADTCFAGLSPNLIDWAGSDSYNHCYVGESGCYSTPWTPGYADFGPLFDYSKLGGQTIQSRHDKWGVTKPFVVGETGTVFDPNNPTRKAQWHRSVAPAARAMEYLAGVAFFDIDATAWEDARNNWILDHRTDVAEIKNAMVEMAQSPWLNTKAPLSVPAARALPAVMAAHARSLSAAEVVDEPVLEPLRRSPSHELIAES